MGARKMLESLFSAICAARFWGGFETGEFNSPAGVRYVFAAASPIVIAIASDEEAKTRHPELADNVARAMFQPTVAPLVDVHRSHLAEWLLDASIWAAPRYGRVEIRSSRRVYEQGLIQAAVLPWDETLRVGFVQMPRQGDTDPVALLVVGHRWRSLVQQCRPHTPSDVEPLVLGAAKRKGGA